MPLSSSSNGCRHPQPALTWILFRAWSWQAIPLGEHLERTDGGLEVLAGLMALHRDANVPSTSWCSLRKQAVALNRSASEGDAAWLNMLQIAAWPVAQAPKLLCDVAWAGVVAHQTSLAGKRDLPPSLPGDDDLPQAIVEEPVGSGLLKTEAYGRIEQVLEERHPDYVVRARGFAESMDVALPREMRSINRLAVAALADARP